MYIVGYLFFFGILFDFFNLIQSYTLLGDVLYAIYGLHHENVEAACQYSIPIFASLASDFGFCEILTLMCSLNTNLGTASWMPSAESHGVGDFFAIKGFLFFYIFFALN
jgi:hypothetical protein